MLDGWSRLDIAGKPVDVFDPPHARPFLLVYLHSLQQETPATDPRFTELLVQHRLRCVAPHGGSCWWADRHCPAFDDTRTPEGYLLHELIPWAQGRWTLRPRHIALAGVEMGGQAAVRLAFKYPQRFPIAASIAGAFDCQEWYGRGTPLDDMYPDRERCRLDTAILHIDPHTWPSHLWFVCSPTDRMSYRGNDRLQEKLQAMGIPHTADLDTPAPAHEWLAPMMTFLVDALHQEARRLL
ncbi:MAG: alpha/beta hydrolase-fold protein [Gemmataceae bacterium]|nr:alpha/beta hydrolase-fold protein [Gemmata sp.]MDW8197938.1 alpha/beta hydrolase-fold protein [Gemmataceae bacterium]